MSTQVNSPSLGVGSRHGLLYFDDGSCWHHYRDHIGFDMFHSHAAALAVARAANKQAGQKVKRVIVAKRHFMVVDAR